MELAAFCLVLLVFVSVVGLLVEAAYRAAASSFSLLRQRKGTKRKATLLPPTLRSATGHLPCAPQAGQPQTRLLCRLKQRVWLLPSGAVRGRRGQKGTGDTWRCGLEKGSALMDSFKPNPVLPLVY